MSAGTENLYRHVVHRGRGERPLIDHAEGVYLFDEDGKRYLDGAAGAALVNMGHGVESVTAAMDAQARKVAYAAPTVFAHQTSLDLGEVISARAPGTMRGDSRTWFTITGTDAVDDALRLARQYFVATDRPSKHQVIARWQSFHGNSLGMAGVHGHTGRRRMFSPMFVNAPHIPPAFCYRCPYGLEYPGCDLRCARALETEIRQQGPENVAAFIAEPVVGAALGAVPAPEGYFALVREICDRYDVLFIADEVMSGWGRCGYWFSIEAWGVTPDIIALGKGLGAGYAPIAATVARDEIWAAIEADGSSFHAGHTMNQNPVGCAAALAVVETIERQSLLENARDLGAKLGERLAGLLDHQLVGDVRGMGMLWGVEIVRDKAAKEPFPAQLGMARRLQRAALELGLVVYACTGSMDGVAGDMILIAPPLLVNEAQIDELVDGLSRALDLVGEQADGD